MLTLLIACTGGEPEVDPVEEPAAAAIGTPELLGGTWMVQVSHPGGMESLSSAGWQSIYENNAAGALRAFGGEGVESGRVHAEAAAVYRQAALVAAWSTLGTYGEELRRDFDPPEVDYLMGVSSVVVGDVDAARSRLGQGGADTALAAADAAWVGMLDGLAYAGWEDEALYPLGEVASGSLPELAPAPHYLFDVEGTEAKLELADPTVLLQAAWWHEAAAVAAAGQEQTDALLGPWRLAGEERRPGAGELPVEALFLSCWSSSGDLAYVAALDEGTPPVEAMEAHAATSLYAAAAKSCHLPEKGIDPDCIETASRTVASELEGAMEQAAGGVQADHRMFASFARAGVLRTAARTEDALGNDYNAALIRTLARDASVGPAADPAFLLSLAAYHSGTRNVLSAAELLHGQVTIVPGLHAARVQLDALSLRVQFDQAGG